MAFHFGVVIYINGVRFDPSSATYSAEEGGEYRFSVDVPAVADWDILPARSHGALFFTDPVTQLWRFMAEGEYVSVSKAKSATGSRQRTLHFRSIFGWWNQAIFTSIMSTTTGQKAPELVNNIELFRFMGRNLEFTPIQIEDPTYNITNLQELIRVAILSNPSPQLCTSDTSRSILHECSKAQ